MLHTFQCVNTLEVSNDMRLYAHVNDDDYFYYYKK